MYSHRWHGFTRNSQLALCKQRIKRIKRIHLLRNYRIKRIHLLRNYRIKPRCTPPFKAPKIRLIRLISC